MGHALPQPPQLSFCVAMSTQRSRQKICPAGHVGTSGPPASEGPGITQRPSPQSCPTGHALPHMPQLRTSLSETQTAPQRLSPGGHMRPASIAAAQRPETQV